MPKNDDQLVTLPFSLEQVLPYGGRPMGDMFRSTPSVAPPTVPAPTLSTPAPSGLLHTGGSIDDMKGKLFPDSRLPDLSKSGEFGSATQAGPRAWAGDAGDIGKVGGGVAGGLAGGYVGGEVGDKLAGALGAGETGRLAGRRLGNVAGGLGGIYGGSELGKVAGEKIGGLITNANTPQESPEPPGYKEWCQNFECALEMHAKPCS